MLKYIQKSIFFPINDPKGIQGNINQLNYEEQEKISKRAYSDYLKSLEARAFENEGNHKLSIAKWRQIFGSNFPEYV